jgi:hypothetical protein
VVGDIQDGRFELLFVGRLSAWVRMVPWPHQPCPHPGCGQEIRDLLAEMVPNEDQAKPDFRALVGQTPGGAITCPYCQRAVEYGLDGQSLVVSARAPLRYSRKKMELRASDYGWQKSPPDQAMTPEQWVAEEKQMRGALQGYTYVEDRAP